MTSYPGCIVVIVKRSQWYIAGSLYSNAHACLCRCNSMLDEVKNSISCIVEKLKKDLFNIRHLLIATSGLSVLDRVCGCSYTYGAGWVSLSICAALRPSLSLAKQPV